MTDDSRVWLGSASEGSLIVSSEAMPTIRVDMHGRICSDYCHQLLGAATKDRLDDLRARQKLLAIALLVGDETATLPLLDAARRDGRSPATRRNAMTRPTCRRCGKPLSLFPEPGEPGEGWRWTCSIIPPMTDAQVQSIWDDLSGDECAKLEREAL